MLYKSKVVIIGAGNVGATVAYTILMQGCCKEIVLIDANSELARAQALDLSHCINHLNNSITIEAGTYGDCSDADIIVIAAAKPLIKGQTRLDMVGESCKIICDIVPKVMLSGFSGKFLVITNPVDVISYCVYKISELTKSQVIGTGTSLDTARLKQMIANRVHLNVYDVDAYAIGEHGDSIVVPWSTFTLGGVSLECYCSSKGLSIEHEEMFTNLKRVGWDIADVKGSTSYGIANIAACIIKAIINDENKVFPVSSYMEGEYGESNIFLSVPTVINASGASRIIELKLNEKEQAKFRNSGEILRDVAKKLYF